MDFERQETNSARLILYAFIRSAFDSPPNQEKFDYWLSLLSSLYGGTGLSELDDAIIQLKSALEQNGLISCQNEYYELFENPFSSLAIHLYASYYIDGKIMGPSLVKLRQLLYNLNIGKVKNFNESEDHLVFLIDLMMFLIQRGNQDSNRSLKAQKEIIEDYLRPIIEGANRVIKKYDDFLIYKSFFKIARSFLSLEQCLFPSG